MENIIISIGRQYGSGGRSIGMALSKRLGFDYFDKELMILAAKENGIAPEFFETNDERSMNIFEKAIQWFENNISNAEQGSVLSADSLFKMQADTIEKLAAEKSCIIVGRCSDYILRNNPNCVSIFLHSSEEERIKRICEGLNISQNEAIEKIIMEDKKRAAYYNFYSNKIWGNSATYNLSIDVSKLGEEKTIEFIISYLKMRFPEQF